MEILIFSFNWIIDSEYFLSGKNCFGPCHYSNEQGRQVVLTQEIVSLMVSLIEVNGVKKLHKPLKLILKFLHMLWTECLYPPKSHMLTS